MSARVKFVNDLEELKQYIYDMSQLLSERFDSLVNVLENNDRALAKELIERDVDINELEVKINDQSVSLITSQSPVASDLRLIISCIKIAEDLERIGDNISNIAEVSRRTQIMNKQILLRLTTMIRLAKLMLDDAMVAMKTEDLSLVNEIIERDNDIDQIFVQVTMSDIYEETDAFVTGQIQLTAKYLERIGDHIENIGEHIFFTLTGKRYK
ncbi:phosphate transport system regulatory protein PhoU [Phocicoccus schoeneichii]|uniref:Phosphate-specific transport system accessory protein PhoU n=1 Tax=Phocicoccus schoeneichii TaxID=1812261 RepID=A0A6V7RIS8_9BACL|nr:phosphate signaling complex protein PhoU [Jeotgalicoccus schoeneichii]GGH48135.1 phosphate transport system regulatory protein PhoU [Jeotgalicoccus schoeneichii]CAD2077053.1 Phosphate-specific transport system accessory protein PhoU [Jeotgalicoccus schoeneichii]